MFGFIKAGLEFNKTANSFGEVYSKLKKFESFYNKREEELSVLRENYKLDVLALAYIVNKEIVMKLEEFNWGLDAKILVNKISSNRITVMQAMTHTVTKVHMLIGLLNLQKEYDDIINDKPLSNVIKKYLENERWMDNHFK